MKILVTGVAGQLGSDVIKEANSRGYKLAGTDLAEKRRFFCYVIITRQISLIGKVSGI